MKSDLTTKLLLVMIAALLLWNLYRPLPARAGGARVTVIKIRPSATPVQLDGYQIVGFSCVSSEECMIASR
ncbi:MAG TPA: hypothetical protein VMB85_13270 [Bryobacteraceae bacterium]|jgi:hypothetical protein|nr:hypothetical protein [Bryobacteraceae bacterium]